MITLASEPRNTALYTVTYSDPKRSGRSDTLVMEEEGGEGREKVKQRERERERERE